MEDKIEVEEFVSSSGESYRFYDSAECCSFGLRDRLVSLLSTCEASLRQDSSSSQYPCLEDKCKTLQSRLHKDHEEILYCLDNLGVLCAYEAVNVCLETIRDLIEDSGIYVENPSPCRTYLSEALGAIGEYLHQGNVTAPGTDHVLKEMGNGAISPKFSELLQMFQSWCIDEQELCLILVDQVIVAKVFERFLQKVASLSHMTVAYLAGSDSCIDALALKTEKPIMESNQKGKANLLIMTNVPHEGILVPNGCCIICFDFPKNVCNFVQWLEQVRQQEYKLIMMLERNNKKQREQLFDMVRSEQSVNGTCSNQGSETNISREFDFQRPQVYTVEHTGASVTADSSIDLIHQYCGKLPGDRYHSPKPIFKLLQSGPLYECKLVLPPNAAFQTIIGPSHHDSQISKQLVCLEACKKLHQMGVLDDDLLPCVDEVHAKQDLDVQTRTLAGVGTTKRKELHGTTHIQSLAGSWGKKAAATTFHAYKIVFPCNIDDESYASFVLLTESYLDDDIACAKIDLHLLSNTVVPSSIMAYGQVNLDVEQVARAMHFQELFFNALYGKLFQGSKKSSDRRFLFQGNSEQLWSPLYMYLLLPLETSSNLLVPGSCSIDWKSIDSCVSAIEFMKKSSWVNPEHSESSSSRNVAMSGDINCPETDVVHLANMSSHVRDLKNIIGFSVHTGRLYTVVDVVAGSSADSPFDGNTDKAKSKFSTFADYYYQKYDVVLSHPKQPLLLMKQSHNPYNLLVDFKKCEINISLGRKLKPGSKATTPNLQSRVHMPPELLVKIDVPVSVLKASYLLPSLMHRLESLMLAGQLRKEIAFKSTQAQIHSTLILEALTTLRCCENFSMERLELLGDSVLKYAVSCHLFLKYPSKHEGKLSAQRSSVVCNATLHKHGSSRRIQEYIRDTAFEPRRWLAPGQLSIHPVPCSHGLDHVEVPLDSSRFITMEENVMIGKSCDKGHRWIVSKTIADCVEALIGAYYVGGGLIAAMHLMKWLGIEVDTDPFSLDKVISGASLYSYTLKFHEIEALEQKLGYEFSVKGLLLEAITHASERESGIDYCYERLEFLGDAALDLLITEYLYQTHSDIDPGELTDLRAASVNNENFAQVAVKRNLYPHLQASSGVLLSQIEEYQKMISDNETPDKSTLGQKGPKALGDLIESIAGAILIDLKLSLDGLWKIYKPLLSPIATPDTLELPPFRELIELCDSLGYYIKECFVNNSDTSRVELRVQLKDVRLIGEGNERTRKAARGQAAAHLLKELQKRGISFAQCVSKRKKQDTPHDGDLSCAGSQGISTAKEDPAEVSPPKKQKTSRSSISVSTPQNSGLPSAGTPAIAGVGMEKGGPRNTLYELCRRLQWQRPSFTTEENKSRSPMEVGEGSEKKTCFISFASTISLCIPDVGVVEVKGDQRADKKSSLDAAALALLYELQKRGLLTIGSGESNVKAECPS